MASKFGVTISDLSDYIAPSQACINPLFVPPTTAAAPSSGGPRVALAFEDSPAAPPAPSPARASIIRASAAPEAAAPPTAKVSLADCLACSGCVTSAETVLLEQQSAEELRRLLRDPAVPGVVVLLAPQALAALAARAGLPPADAYARLAAFFKGRLGCAAVADTAVGAAVALAEAGDEVLARLRDCVPLPPWASPPHSLPFSATRVGGAAPGAPPAPPQHHHQKNHTHRAAPLPVLASACPGWVCFAEKTLPEALPYASAARSPQQLTGALAKAALRAWGAPPGAAVVAVMACYDKKLEATRRDFAWEGEGADGSGGGAPLYACKEVDCVLAASEVEELLRAELGVAGLAAMAPEALAPGALFGGAAPARRGAPFADLEALLRGLVPAEGAAGGVALAAAAPGGAAADSDGHCAYAYVHAARVLAGAPLGSLTAVPFAAGRNTDFREAKLRVSSEALSWLRAGGGGGGGDVFAGGDGGDAAGAGGATLIFATAYGFRNIQGVAARLKKAAGASGGGGGGGSVGALAYVEVMACPKGCVGGGGLPREGAGTAGNAAVVADALRAALAAATYDPHAVCARLRAVVPAFREAGAWRALVATRFHAVPPLEGEAAGFSQANKW